MEHSDEFEINERRVDRVLEKVASAGDARIHSEEAARVLGAGRWTTFRKVMLPALRPAIAAGALLTFARSLGEFGAIVFVSGNIPNKTLTAPVLITQLILANPAQAAAISALLFGISFLLVLATEKLLSRHSEVFWA